MKTPTAPWRGELVASLLTGSWRDDYPSLHLSLAELDQVTPLLCGSGAGGLGWWRIRQTGLAASPSGEVLRQAYRLQTLQAKIHETKIQKIVRLLRGANVEPILIKGWAMARLYREPALRPYGDIDLWVRASDYRGARAVVESEEARGCWIDLHTSISELDDRRVEDLLSRSELVPCGEEQVRVLAPEHHLALLAIHLLKHGAWRPLWLCDIAVLIESMAEDFDWEVCLGSNGRQRNWILSAVGLAHVLLNASRQAVPGADPPNLPGWVVTSVLKQWSNLYPADHLPIQAQPLMTGNLRSPRALLKGLLERWPDPITATFNLRSKFNNFPRLPYQLTAFGYQAGQFLFRLPRAKRKLN